MRQLDEFEVERLLASDTVARFSTVEADGFPHITPIWFLWADGRILLTSYARRPHLRRVAADSRVGLVIDVEEALRADGERPNRQVRVIGDATVDNDPDGLWTARIRAKYLGPDAPTVRAERKLITVVPRRIVAVASV
ncbi:pyridoxamine 5'-phosphate oxidase family protein [Nocardia tengchongensis]|uniref:Pyridoxamine 5'-phosphate oxidase family protein n=1 Tax=Nocardia tengchongensis TaxID=2055889 RepID=A0ABX8CVL4_9NOCA|nr:pyridoxamine 5'-phosphate oxidase family protein [Nocardia tengchongensis]QVI23951.1 pyridoxamine 5'-phosphate oxidase family protein [Nocardia tengchongensis]